jgi:hypothetical protein
MLIEVSDGVYIRINQCYPLHGCHSFPASIGSSVLYVSMKSQSRVSVTAMKIVCNNILPESKGKVDSRMDSSIRRSTQERSRTRDVRLNDILPNPRGARRNKRRQNHRHPPESKSRNKPSRRSERTSKKQGEMNLPKTKEHKKRRAKRRNSNFRSERKELWVCSVVIHEGVVIHDGVVIHEVVAWSAALMTQGM